MLKNDSVKLMNKTKKRYRLTKRLINGQRNANLLIIN